MGRKVLTADQQIQEREKRQEIQRRYRAAHPEKYQEARRRLKIWKMAKGPSTEEEKAKNRVQSQAFRDARRARGEKAPAWISTPEKKAKRAAQERVRDLKRRLEGRPRILTEEQRQRKALRCAAWVRRSPSARPWAESPTGSVLACAAPSEARDLLAQITQAVPRCDDRDEIIAEACLLVLSGKPIEEAIPEARKVVRRNAAPLAYAKPLHDCFWL